MLKTALFVTSTLLSLISAEVIHLKTTNFDNVVDGTRNVLVKFEASWCGPCKAMVPILDQVSNEFPDINGDTVIAAVDVDDEELLANRFQVRALPTVKLFLKGRSQEDHIEYESYRERDVESITNFIKTAIGIC